MHSTALQCIPRQMSHDQKQCQTTSEVTTGLSVGCQAGVGLGGSLRCMETCKKNGPGTAKTVWGQRGGEATQKYPMLGHPRGQEVILSR